MINELGNRYGKLVVRELSEVRQYGRTDRSWICQCDCGNLHIVCGSLLRGGKIRSCGCSRLRDKTGNRYGKLTVIERDQEFPRNWICKCDCGNIKSIPGGFLQPKGGTKSCGCLEDIISVIVGEVYGKLAVIENPQNSSNKWKCRCICGKDVEVTGYQLRSGNKKSCSRQCAHVKEEGVSSFNYIYRNYKNGAKSRGLSWEITKEQFGDLSSKPCCYCGNPPAPREVSTKFHGNYSYNGLDRVDSSKGYTIQNVVPCCWECNRAKSTMPLGKFKEMISKIYFHWIKS